jgi:NAD-dependent deacetylase
VIVDRDLGLVDACPAIVDCSLGLVDGRPAIVDRGLGLVDACPAIVDCGLGLVDGGPAFVDRGLEPVDARPAIVDPRPAFVDGRPAIVDRSPGILDADPAIHGRRPDAYDGGMSSELSALAERIRGARRLTVLTGAGVSAASGVPTFRGEDGLWRRFRPEQLATPEAFRRDPDLVWEWYAWRREKIAACQPNAAHEIIARWSRQSTDCRVLTQNVDDLHVRAGTRNLVRLHGSIWELACASPRDGCPGQWRDDRVPLPELPPRCPSCGGLARPAVVWFGESLADDDVRVAHEATLCDVFVTIGTSSLVYPAAGLVVEARRRGAFTAEVNLDDTPASSEVDVSIRGRVEDVLPRL